MPFLAVLAAAIACLPGFAASRPPLLGELAQGAASPEVIVHVGLVRAFGHPRTLTIEAPLGARLLDESGEVKLRGPGTWTLAGTRDGIIVVRGQEKRLSGGKRIRIVAGGEEPLRLAERSRPRAYRGELEVTSSRSGGLLVVDCVPLESYLRGVVAAEMESSAPMEALRAQAVAARTYAVKNLGHCQSRGYDLSDTTDSQVYDGVAAEHDSTDQAVRDTAGLVLERGGTLCQADYYADCGGVTAPGSEEDDYPPSVMDGPEGGGEYCAAGPHHTWTLRVSAEALAHVAGRKVGRLTDVKVVERDSSGRAQTVELAGSQGARRVPGAKLRAALGYARLRSTLFSVARDGDDYVFAGRGFGHGHGMCQCGAVGMAGAPYNRTYRQILAHYFPGAVVVPLGPDVARKDAKSAKNAVRRSEVRCPKSASDPSTFNRLVWLFLS